MISRVFRRARLAAALCLWSGLAAPAFAQGPSTPAPVNAPPQDSHQMPMGEGEYPRLRLAGFGDVNFARVEHAEGPKNFSLGQFVLHLTSQLSSRVTVFGEISFSARTDAGTGTPPAAGFNTEIERLIIRFDHSDWLRASFGRYHTPINYWNTAYHHGSWLQTTISRPEMIQFGGKFLPVHFVGAQVEGTLPAGGWNVGYKGGVGNGRNSTVISRAGDAGDSNGSLASLINVVSKPDKLYGLEFGGSAYADTITPTTGGKVGERIFAAHAAFLKETPEVIAEVASVRHEEAGGETVWSHAYYIQGAYRLSFDDRKWKAYYRFEHIGIPATDVVFKGIPNLDGSTVGLRYDASPYAAIKGEYRTWTRGPGTTRNQGGFFQVSFTF
jgi:hypothetical protein